MVTYATSYLESAGAIVLSPSTNNNVAWHNYGSVIIPPLAGAFSLTGIIAPIYNLESLATGDAGDTGYVVRGPLFVLNASGQSMSVTSEGGSSTAANRILVPGLAPAASLTVADGYTATFLYDYNAQRWRLIKPA